MTDLITRLIPTPTPVTLGGRVYPVWEARLADLALLQKWIDGRRPDPIDGLRDRLSAETTDAGRDRVLFTAYGDDGGGVPYHSAAGRVLLSTPEGVTCFLRTALSRGTPGLTDDDLFALLGDGGFTGEEFARLERVFFGRTAAREIEAMLGIPPAPARGKPATWSEAVDAVASGRGWTYEYIYSLTLTEFASARRGGKPVEHGFRGTPAVLESLRTRMLAAMPELNPEPTGGTGPRPEEPDWVYPAGHPDCQRPVDISKDA